MDSDAVIAGSNPPHPGLDTPHPGLDPGSPCAKVHPLDLQYTFPTLFLREGPRLKDETRF